jgi:hypothetical protein
MKWHSKSHSKIDDFFVALDTLTNSGMVFAYRGLPDSAYTLLSTLDRLLPKEWPYERRLAEESAIIVKFCSLAIEFCDIAEKAYLQGPVPQDRMKALPILRHYGAPTRLLDWTSSPLVALYFAAISHFDRDGAIWWFDQQAFVQEVGPKWENYGLTRYPVLNNGVNLNDTAFNNNGPAWISLLLCTIPFHRIEAQHGFFTVAGRLGLDHAERIANILPDGKYGRIIVPSLWKQHILDRLRTMNIHSKSIDYPGADLVGMNLFQNVMPPFPEISSYR